MQQPLVSCIMPTHNRRKFIPHAIRYFLRQEYEHKELIIIDDGTDKIEELVPGSEAIRYIRLDNKMTLGSKLNLACKYAKGSVIANWDDDDWYAPRRLQYQVDTLQQKGIDICGINNLFYYDMRNQSAYQYIYPAGQRPWLLGSSLCYKKELWSRKNFADINVGMDGLFVWGTPSVSVKVLPDPAIAVHMIHDHNVSEKKTDGAWWHNYPLEQIQKIMGADWSHYQDERLTAVQENNRSANVRIEAINSKVEDFKNIYACLVHENEACIIDLVRNLHYHDPSSIILLYNGGTNARLLKNNFPYEKFGAVIHPKPVPVKHGYLHNFAISCMEFALQNFQFDSFTIVDSDQLAIRPGYRDYLSNFFSAQTNIGMLSSMPAHLNAHNVDAAGPEVWPAAQALKEYDLWKPLLSYFPNGESKFVHWTFWPSTVFTKDAAKDLVNLFRKNKLLQNVMRQSKIWATEEVILPTLVSLLGYKIASNPCSYDFVKYRRSFTLQDANIALNKKDAFWMHPVERKYEDRLRTHTRQHFAHYVSKKSDPFSAEQMPTDLFLNIALINKIKNIQGWLNEKEAQLLMTTAMQACKDFPAPNSIVEIGSYHGRSTILFGNIVKEFFPGVKVFAIDPHDGKLGAADQGIQIFPPSYEMFKRNIQAAALGDVVDIIKNNSSNVKWNKPVSLLFIDGLHDYPSVAADFYHFAQWIKPGGYVAFHDYAEYFPGVKAFVDELLQKGSYNSISKVESLVVLQKQVAIVKKQAYFSNK